MASRTFMPGSVVASVALASGLLGAIVAGFASKPQTVMALQKADTRQADFEELNATLREERQKRIELAETVSALSIELKAFRTEQDKKNTALDLEDDKLRTAIKKERDALAYWFASNNPRVAWRLAPLKTPVKNASGRKHDRNAWDGFEVNFAPDSPLSADSKDLVVLISGVSCQRGEHNVSTFYATTKEVKLDGTKVTGQYRFNLSDNDNNNSTGDETQLVLVVIAKIKVTDAPKDDPPKKPVPRDKE